MRGAIRAAVSLRARARADTVSAASCVRQLQKMQQIAQTLKSENNTLKAPGGVAAELAKRDDTIQRLKQEAKAVIDKLKQKHAEELRNLQNENAVVLANAGSSNIGAPSTSSRFSRSLWFSGACLWTPSHGTTTQSSAAERASAPNGLLRSTPCTRCF